MTGIQTTPDPASPDSASPDPASADEAAPAPRRLGEEVLLDYAAGALDEATALLVAAHLTLCPRARAAVSAAEAVGGLMLAGEAPVPLREGALDRLFARLEGTADAVEVAPVPTDDEIAGLPAPVRRRIATHGGRWSFVAPGVRDMDLGFDAPRGAGASRPGAVKLYRIEPGRGVPSHTHRGSEVTLVLAGAFADGHDRYGPGDIAVATPRVTHKPVAEPGAVCYALAITDAPLQLTGALGLVQRALGGAD